MSCRLGRGATVGGGAGPCLDWFVAAGGVLVVGRAYPGSRLRGSGVNIRGLRRK